jgi:glycosyltransferase involved in cell wall biosynthesis
MLTVNYVTRPYFHDIALELIQELKQKCILNVIIIVSPWNIDYLAVKDESIKGLGKSFKLTKQISNKIYLRYESYFNGANVIFRYEEPKETSIKNTLSWKKLLSKNKNILQADLNIIESFSIAADWYFLQKIRNKKIYNIIHDPVPHTGEKRRWADLASAVFYKHVDKFLQYSNFSTDLFNENFPQYVGKTITLQTPIYTNLKVPVKDKISSSKEKVLFFGRISPYKGVELFYSAAEQLSKEFKDVLFIIAGKALIGYSPQFLDNNSNPNIQILNQFIDLNTLSELMSDSSFCVLPYLDATQSGVVMTAYAYDLPVLVSDCPGLLEYCFDASNFSFKNGDLSDLISKMRNLLLNAPLLKEYKKDIDLYSDANVSENNVIKILGS